MIAWPIVCSFRSFAVPVPVAAELSFRCSLSAESLHIQFKKTHIKVIIIFSCFSTPLILDCEWKSLVIQVSVSTYAAGKADELSWIKSGIMQTEFKTDLRLKKSGQFIVSLFEHLLTFWPVHDCTVSSKSRKYNINLTWKPLPLWFLT